MAEATVALPVWLAWVLGALMVLVVLVAVGAVVAWSRLRESASERSRARVDAENQRIDAELRLAELTDRIRLMTEIHDSAAVAITSVISQAEGARLVSGAEPEAATRAASAIADQARGALADLRRVANVGRSGDDQSGSMPSLSSIEELFQGINDSGLIVRFEEAGSPFAVNSSAEIALYRIVQEALNNCRQHAGAGTTVRVSMNWSGNGLQLRIDDDGTRVRNSQREQWGESPGYSIADDQRALVEMLDGRGMKDMKARTEAFGGVFSAHRVPGVGFSISAAFPTLRFHNAVKPISSGPVLGPTDVSVGRDVG